MKSFFLLLALILGGALGAAPLSLQSANATPVNFSGSTGTTNAIEVTAETALLVVCIGAEGGGEVESVRWGDQPLTQSVEEQEGGGYATIWHLASPSPGSGSLTVELGAGQGFFNNLAQAGVYLLSGNVGQVPVAASDSKAHPQGSGPGSATIEIPFTELPPFTFVVDCSYANNGGHSMTPGPEQTRLFSAGAGGGSTIASSYAFPEAGDFTASVERPGTNRLVYVSVAFASAVDSGGSVFFFY